MPEIDGLTRKLKANGFVEHQPGKPGLARTFSNQEAELYTQSNPGMVKYWAWQVTTERGRIIDSIATHTYIMGSDVLLEASTPEEWPLFAGDIVTGIRPGVVVAVNSRFSKSQEGPGQYEPVIDTSLTVFSTIAVTHDVLLSNLYPMLIPSI